MTQAHKPEHEFFVGIDSDGCAFDTMEVKHKECFIPNIVKFYGLASVSKYVREAAEFINLYSTRRGVNRFPGLVLTLDLVAERAEVKRRNVSIPKLVQVRKWLESETKLGNPALAQAIENGGGDELAHLLEWSKAVNATISEIVSNVPPFPNVRECLEKLHSQADVFVVSATPTEALTREWEEHGLRPFVQQICGQEAGTKGETLAVAQHYESGRALMVGDAPGDMKAARDNGVLFFPINPGHEEASWRRLFEEGIDRFLAGRFAGEYEQSLIDEFRAYLPEVPPWER